VYASSARRWSAAAAARFEDRDRAYQAIATIAAMASRIHGQTGADELAGAAGVVADAPVLGAIELDDASDDDDELEVDVDVDVEVEVEVEVDVEVVFVLVGAAVDVEVEVEVEVAVDGLIGDRLDAGASVVGGVAGASVVRVAVRVGRVGAEIVRETLGRLEPPPQEAARTASVSAIERARNARARSPSSARRLIRRNRSTATPRRPRPPSAVPRARRHSRRSPRTRTGSSP